MKQEPIFSHPTKFRDIDIALMVSLYNVESVVKNVDPDDIIENDELRDLFIECQELFKRIEKLLPKPKRKFHGRSSKQN